MTTYEGNATLMIEGERLTDNRVVERGALTWPETPIPILLDFGTGEPIGQVDRIWREGDTVRAHWTAERPLQGLACAIGTRLPPHSVSGPIGDFIGDEFRIRAAEITEVVPCQTPACPAAKFEDA